MITRRNFIASTATAAALSSLAKPNPLLSAQEVAKDSKWPIAVFEKVFEGLTYEELAGAIHEIGADGVEATIRPKGHIEPEAAAEEVPKMVEALAARGKRITIAATHIGSVDEPHTEALLKTLKTNGITHFRLGHFRYDLSKPMFPQLREYAAQAKELAALCKEIGIQGLYQNHSGASKKKGFVGALGWDAAFLLEGIDPDSIGIALDTRHLRKDTGSSWQVAVAACKPHIRSIYIKDGIWHGERGDQYKDVPVDTGFVNKDIFQQIRAGLDPMPLCIHMEWLGYRIFEKHEIPEAIKAHQRDLAALKNWLK